MRYLLFLFLTILPAQAATFSLDLGKVYSAVKHKHDQVPARVKWRRATAAIAGAATIGDYVSTHNAIDRGLCEANPFLQAENKCSVNNRRFTALKIGTLAWLFVGEEIAHKLPHGRIWDKENTIINLGLATWYTTITIHNASQ